MSESAGLDEWISETTAFDRVQSISTTVSEPTTVSEIAEEAQVAENTARSHLSRLSGLGVLQEQVDEGVTVYYPDPLYTRMRTLREFLDSHDKPGLIEARAAIQERIESWEDEYEVDNPQSLRLKASEAESAEETREYGKVASEWEHSLYRLSIVSEAIENYEMYTQSR